MSTFDAEPEKLPAERGSGPQELDYPDDPYGPDHPLWNTADSVQEWAERAGWASGIGLGISMAVGLGATVFTVLGMVLMVSLLVGRVAASAAESDGSVRSGLTGKAVDLWDNEAASFYGLLSLSRFVYLEVLTFISEFEQAAGVLDFIQSELFETLIGFSVASVNNLVAASIWPVMMFGQYGLTAIIGLGVGYTIWDKFHDWVDLKLGRVKPADAILPEIDHE